MRNEDSVPTNDKQTPPLQFDPSFMKNAECAEYNEKNNKHIFWFLFFELSWVVGMGGVRVDIYAN